MPSFLRHNNLIPASIKTYKEFEKAMTNLVFAQKVYLGIWSMPQDLAGKTELELSGIDLDWRNFFERWNKENASKY